MQCLTSEKCFLHDVAVIMNVMKGNIHIVSAQVLKVQLNELPHMYLPV